MMRRQTNCVCGRSNAAKVPQRWSLLVFDVTRNVLRQLCRDCAARVQASMSVGRLIETLNALPLSVSMPQGLMINPRFTHTLCNPAGTRAKGACQARLCPRRIEIVTRLPFDIRRVISTHCRRHVRLMFPEVDQVLSEFLQVPPYLDPQPIEQPALAREPRAERILELARTKISLALSAPNPISSADAASLLMEGIQAVVRHEIVRGRKQV